MTDANIAFTPLQVRPVTLEGRWVCLSPLRPEHAAGIVQAAEDEEVWQYLPVALRTLDDVHVWIDEAMRNEAGGTELPFVTIERATGQVIGSTRFMDIRPAHRGLEIGWTWLGRPWWRTRVNSEAKYLMLRHAFDTLGSIRVCLKTDALNLRSQRAIERLGARYEGTLRKHMIVRGSRYRDSVHYSILDDEWPPIRARMEEELYGDGPS